MPDSPKLFLKVLKSAGYPELNHLGFKKRYAIISKAYKNTKMGLKLTLVFFASFCLSLALAAFLIELDLNGDVLGYSMLLVLVVVYGAGYYWLSYRYVTPEVKRLLAEDTL